MAKMEIFMQLKKKNLRPSTVFGKYVLDLTNTQEDKK